VVKDLSSAVFPFELHFLYHSGGLPTRHCLSREMIDHRLDALAAGRAKLVLRSVAHNAD
jgi:hypothetical protein